MSPAHDENAFGSAIVAALCERGWREGSPAEYRPDIGLNTGELFEFIGRSQPDEWHRLRQVYGDPNEAQRGFAQRLDKAISENGLLHVLRNGVKDRGVLIRVAYFKPNLVADDSILDGYRANRLTVVRELPYATKQTDWGHKLDLALFLNGIPVATAELKNPLTGQGVERAKEQYRADRDPTELIFTRRVVANFAVDPDLVFVATQLRGKATRFLPLNTGSNGPGQPGGAGNPAPTAFGTYATSYLWEQLWERDNWLDLLHRYVHQQKHRTPGGGSTRSTIFPRFHQWDAVRKLAAHAATHGAGQNYLVMASAGSGKSNTIGWLVHRLSDLHADNDPRTLDTEALAAGRIAPGEPVFDKIIVITDRRNLDAQLRETVGGFSQTEGLVVKIDERHGAKSEQLARALARDTGKIVTVTLHSFPALLDYLKRNPTELKGGRFAIVIDEAHSSQSGDASTAVRSALRDLGLDSDSDDEGATTATVDDQLKKKAVERSRAANLSYFAFTATPKAKTLELFGAPVPENGKEVYRPFHTYSMRQAIEEGFILDPLRNYVTYNTYWKLVNQNPDEMEVDPSKANSLLARFALTHDHTVSQHAQVIVEHFVTHTRGRLGGRAKSMVVTASRQSAVQMARAIKSYIKDREYDTKYPDLGVLVAFSGSLTLDGEETTETKENGGIAESALPKAFGYTRADDKAVKAGGKGDPEYKILVVAEKYQTGFDQPLLTTMYVNKKLTGISAVQTLSRLNRTADRKSQADLAVLDFVNDAEDIQDAFRPYFEEAHTLPSDPNLLYTAQGRVMGAPVITEQEMDAFAAAYFAAKEKAAGSQAKWEKRHAELYRLLGPAVARFTALLDDPDDDDSVEAAEDFRADLHDYVRKYGFLAQIVPYQDPELERLHLYGRHLLNRLPRRADGGVDVGEIDLSHLRVVRTGEVDVSLSPEGPAELKGFGDGAGGAQEAEKSLLSELIDRFNEKFGTDFTEADVLPAFLATKEDPKVKAAALVNDEENFAVVWDKKFNENMMDHISHTADLGRRYFAADSSFKSNLDRSARRAAWRMIRDEEGLD
ncbi:type I restriction endonuclease subunit R [Streptomyces diastaticus subsp. diastaticus]|uniref:Type I restriction endonuclease subunit R n=1 Tax=Streptomyces diastaticus subsp. diastaticus TaxID=68040 RepID=A0ABQ1CW74_STRDI|nr:DEAD/DEAH box helicase family protein [Streptomyces diastaticus]GFH74564.1 type I restriction endonuclease subunit R [Streptomyces diastaticus subsp. diastaticus]GGU03896.1 type I restriction endonuclease subunit R [Streptomyces diastaticus subsp. diastaticus]